jgi:polyisoprenyl-teichoic acid--peptidoglycan teichoic acid transferase
MANSSVQSTQAHQSQKGKTRQSQPPADDMKSKPNQSRKPNPPKKNKRSHPFYRGFVWGATVSVTAAISAIAGATMALVSPSSLNLASLKMPWEKVANSTSNQALDALFPQSLTRPVNILVMGVDRVPNVPLGSAEAFSGHSDTILLFRIDPSDRSVRLLSIPRDTRVEMPGVGFGKINDANVRGGPALASRTVSKTLNNIAVERYIRVTPDAFRELVNLVGGVEVFVPYSMSYQDLSQNLQINLQAGWQTLDGEGAEQFVRFRNDKFGDIGRVQRQQVLLKALQKRLYSPAMLPRLPQAIRILQQYVDTNLSLDEMLALASFGRDLTAEKIKMVMLPGRFSQKAEYDTKSYWIISDNGRDRVMQEYFDQGAVSPVEVQDPHKIRIAIQNATDDPGIANRIVEYFQKQNFHNVYVTPEPLELLQETEIVVQQGDLTTANALKNVLGIGRVEASSTGNFDSDLTIRIGQDAKQLLAKDSFTVQ